jgi:hypothetical protein
MYQNNPNIRAQPFQPRQPERARPMQGGRNPYGFGSERVAGQLAVQPNLPGMPTNTQVMPSVPDLFGQSQRQRLRSFPFGY